MCVCETPIMHWDKDQDAEMNTNKPPPSPLKHARWWSLFCGDEWPNEMAAVCVLKGRVLGVIWVIKVNACLPYCLPFAPPPRPACRL